jgi:hypothetical protein
MKVRDRATDRILRAAAWTYLAPRVAIGAILLAVLGLATFMVLIQFVMIILRQLGA